MQSQSWLAEQVVTSWAFKLLSGRLQALLLANTTLSLMPDVPNPQNAIQTLLSEAQHFRRGIRECLLLNIV
jgi:hypothetical protein